MAIVRIKDYRDQKVGELLNIFRLPCVSPTGYPSQIQVKPGPEPVGGLAVNMTRRSDKTSRSK